MLNDMYDSLNGKNEQMEAKIKELVEELAQKNAKMAEFDKQLNSLNVQKLERADQTEIDMDRLGALVDAEKELEELKKEL